MRPPDGGGPRAFVENMERIIQPRDSAQRSALRPHLDITDRRNREIVDAARGSMRVAMDSMRTAIAPLLDAAQLDRFDRFLRQPPPGRGPPGLETGGRRGPR